MGGVQQGGRRKRSARAPAHERRSRNRYARQAKRLVAGRKRSDNLPSMRACVLAFCCLLGLPLFAFAWGGDGHQIVALIAEDRLSSAAKEGIHALLGDANISDAEIA